MFTQEEIELMIELLKWCRVAPDDPQFARTVRMLNDLHGKLLTMQLTAPGRDLGMPVAGVYRPERPSNGFGG